MKRTIQCVLLGLAAALGSAASTHAAALRVSPTQIELRGGEATTLLVRNEDRQPVVVQVRVFRSVPAAGGLHLEPTSDVVASPPITTLQPGTENLIRIVRVSDTPLAGSETYRLLVDEVPDPRRQATGTVAIVVRHSIPVSFAE